ncbi:hypothetical protein GLOIN_2v1789395 [Rhizophagus irregularis DAOM 181602=DAOM 197198]|uniref:Uncharacterized protein n=1 Tax=Rhizophagus irregularis (strain DAOM 181602 / DAOM 197198 / MUCL 43194) TaxID=747089 RepID=A0A2P4P1H9_RHIID|nr:hypothetical protein GLOIN_2v1789395 [Rhizophagus irregularis DAOM 181602=DAOM 197198]POG59231.1 hypothetical protein GLOIN_2v1789395 [Rhizophagus irregularis DAOM 181602=DAOM 197198]GBC33450.2 hypothetical protein GLOIN_2v1789395 [Rhizophagus irregularis DAOM 181602=DAOM 197198]|eukprot:XP_025166097.1 hypothetical protein GLOIN_2v1789395 [Rhizophagus irregularis DAOM 181602=DAOM 197198]
MEVEGEAAESANKEVVVVNEKSSNDDDDDDDDNDDDDNDNVGKTEDHKKPEVFQLKSNLEIVAWLVNHPEILRLALEMNKTMLLSHHSLKLRTNKFNQIILTSVKEFKEIRKNRASTGSLSQKELIDYVDEEFV